MIIFNHTGDFKNSERFFTNAMKLDFMSILRKYGQVGVGALASATPVASGATAGSWKCDVSGSREFFKLTWSNTNVSSGVVIAIILQYGHGTGTGGFVQGRDYINPAMRPVFDKIADDIWREVTNL